MAEKKVLTNPNLLNIILDYVGITIHKLCDSCGKVLKYQIFNQQIEQSYKSYINFKICNKSYFCDEECLYKKKFNNIRFCISLVLTFIISGLLIWLFYVLFNDKNTEIPVINLSV